MSWTRVTQRENHAFDEGLTRCQLFLNTTYSIPMWNQFEHWISYNCVKHLKVMNRALTYILYIILKKLEDLQNISGNHSYVFYCLTIDLEEKRFINQLEPSFLDKSLVSGNHSFQTQRSLFSQILCLPVHALEVQPPFFLQLGLQTTSFLYLTNTPPSFKRWLTSRSCKVLWVNNRFLAFFFVCFVFSGGGCVLPLCACLGCMNLGQFFDVTLQTVKVNLANFG